MWMCDDCGKEVVLKAKIFARTAAEFKLDADGRTMGTAIEVEPIDKERVLFSTYVDEYDSYICLGCKEEWCAMEYDYIAQVATWKDD